MPAVSATISSPAPPYLVSKTIGKMWSKLSPEQQQPYKAAYVADVAAQREAITKMNQEARDAEGQRRQHDSESKIFHPDLQGPLLASTHGEIGVSNGRCTFSLSTPISLDSACTSFVVLLFMTGFLVWSGPSLTFFFGMEKG